jgi:mycothiol S-conjugate amidase
MAKYVAEGARVLVATCTGGERGSVLNPALQGDPDVLRDMVEYRRREMAKAVAELGVEHTWLGFVDSGLPEGDPPPLPEGCFALEPLETAAAPLVRVIREFRPHVVTTYDENGGYPHPDHIMCHKISIEAFDAAPDPARYPGTGQPWQPLKLYYDRGFSRERVEAFHTAMLAEGLESPFGEWLQRWEEEEGPSARLSPKVTTRVECADWFPVRDRALLAHATQIDPNGWFFSIPLELQRRVWPTEDFELVRTLVPSQVPEDDLFAGVREHLEESAEEAS